jgi:hypothetical protein
MDPVEWLTESSLSVGDGGKRAAIMSWRNGFTSRITMRLFGAFNR